MAFDRLTMRIAAVTYRKALFFNSATGVFLSGLGELPGESFSDSSTIALAIAKSSSFIFTRLNRGEQIQVFKVCFTFTSDKP